MLKKVARAVRSSIQKPAAPAPAPAPVAPFAGSKAEARAAKLDELDRKQAETLAKEQALDAERYLEHSIPPATSGRLARLKGMQLDASATRLYHRVEKGFSLPAPRRPFGAKAVPGLAKVFANKKHDPNALYAVESKLVLDALEAWNERGERVDEVAPRGDSLPTNPLTPEQLSQFMTSRHSIRDFEQRPMDDDLVREVVRIAMSAPSVCNRQGWRVHYYSDKADLNRILPLHGGSAGFADNIPGLFVVTYDIRSFEGPNERNQGWIDGGLFAMTLMLSLHGMNLGAVPLNWARSNNASDMLREVTGIPEHENIVMLMAAGHPAEGYRVARSARRPLDTILRFGSTTEGGANNRAKAQSETQAATASEVE